MEVRCLKMGNAAPHVYRRMLAVLVGWLLLDKELTWPIVTLLLGLAGA